MVYKVRDLMVNVIRAGGSGGSTLLPADDGTPIPTHLTPIAIDASMVALTSIINTAGPALADAVKDVPSARAFVRDSGFAEEVTATLIGAAALQSRGGSAGMPDPNCGGTSLETIPPTLTPYVHKAKTLLRAEDLAVLKARLTRVLEAVEVAEKSLTPRGKEAADLAERLRGAAAELSRSAATSA
jgi:hypothetical protein